MKWGHPNQDKLLLLVGDISLILLVTVPGWYISTAVLSSSAHKVMSLMVLLLTFLATIYLLDLYSLAELNGLGTLVKVIIAVATAGVLCNSFFGLFHLRSPGDRSLELCVLILPAATYAWRRFYYYSSRRFRTPEVLVVVGTTKDSEILSATIRGLDHRYNLSGMLCTEPERQAHVETHLDSGFSSRHGSVAVDVTASRSYSVGTAVALARDPVWSEGGLDREAVPYLGAATSENLLQVVAQAKAKVIVVRSDTMTSELAGTLTRLRFSGIQVYSLLDFCMSASEQLPLDILSESWFCVADGFRLLQVRVFRRFKRLCDLLLACAGLLVALPFTVGVAIAVWLDSPGPIFFRQRRVGWMGRPFDLLKFRTMKADAERNGEAQWAALDDPRVTRVGRILRKTHFDELPQMINILRGEMSFVGPRPERPEFVGLLNESMNFYDLRHYVLPGITGWAQVNYPYGASLDDARRKLQYDLYYVYKASPLLDLRTLLKTARVVLFQRGSR